MSGVYIKGMEMPKRDHYFLLAPNGNIYDADVGLTLTPQKAIPVPDHGRLIDADKVLLQIQEYIDEYGWTVDEHGWHSDKWCAMKEAEDVLNDAPTIIPTDKEGER